MEETRLEKFNVINAAISTMRSDFMSLKITDLNDKENYLKVHDARMVVRGKRIEVEKVRKELKENILKEGRVIDDEAKRITGLLEPIEEHLSSQERAVDDEKERQLQEKKKAYTEKVNTRTQALAKYGATIDYGTIVLMTDESFASMLTQVRDEWEVIEAKRIEGEVARKAEASRLERVAKEQEVMKQKLADEAARIDLEQKTRESAFKLEQDRQEAKNKADREAIEAEKKALEDKKAEELRDKQRQIELEAAKKKAAADAKLEAEAKMARDEEEKIAKAQAVKAEEERLAKLRPDRDRLLIFAKELKAMTVPEVTSDEAEFIRVATLGRLSVLANDVENWAKNLHKAKGRNP